MFSLSFPVTHVCAGGYHHWCLRLYFQSFLNIQPEISSQKQTKKIRPTYPNKKLCYANQTHFLGLSALRHRCFIKSCKYLKNNGYVLLIIWCNEIYWIASTHSDVKFSNYLWGRRYQGLHHNALCLSCDKWFFSPVSTGSHRDFSTL